jgi:hypothetical protein
VLTFFCSGCWAEFTTMVCVLWQSDAGKQNLRAQVLSSEEACACAYRWQDDSLRYAVERAGFWMQPPPHFGHDAGSHEEAGETSLKASGDQMGQQPGDAPISDRGGLVTLAGLELPFRQSLGNVSPTANTSFIATDTVTRTLEAASLVLCQQKPLLLEGPPGQIQFMHILHAVLAYSL